MSLENFRKICIRGLRQEMTYGLSDSGSAFHGIVQRLTEQFGYDNDEAIITAQEWEKEAGYNRTGGEDGKNSKNNSK